ncbi:LdpA C-terminal domain-containing domain [Synechococcus sp. M16CYN]|uniref:Light dependent period protein LdpA domain-containing protein n=1 Tax=Synechococcus sp. M16CYN TaxID=3103139 RepID=UPI0032549307
MAINAGLTQRLSPEESLTHGCWVKLICGASNQDLPSITDLCAVYSMVGVHCIDVAANPAVVHAARLGLAWVEERSGYRPWLMVSLSDGLDVHFRKAWFDPTHCPPECKRPCQHVCPAEAIAEWAAVDPQLCYGCGRCLPACSYGLIKEQDYSFNLEAVGDLLVTLQPDAVEIHTAPDHDQGFDVLMGSLDKVSLSLQRLAVSCGLERRGMGMVPERIATTLWRRHARLRHSGFRPLWQLDGKPMSGDIGAGTARSAVKLWRAMNSIAPPGPLQLAGGTNHHTLKHLDCQERPAGIAFGGAARRLLMPLLREAQHRGISLRDWPEGWERATTLAQVLVAPWINRSC